VKAGSCMVKNQAKWHTQGGPNTVTIGPLLRELAGRRRCRIDVDSVEVGTVLWRVVVNAEENEWCHNGKEVSLPRVAAAVCNPGLQISFVALLPARAHDYSGFVLAAVVVGPGSLVGVVVLHTEVVDGVKVADILGSFADAVETSVEVPLAGLDIALVGWVWAEGAVACVLAPGLMSP